MTERLQRDYHIGDEIGRGRFGVVRRSISVASGDLFAVKSIDKRPLAADDRECIDREAKIALLASAGNPSVVQIHDAYEDDDSLHIVMDLCPGPDLFDRIRARGGASPFSEPEAAAIVAELTEAVAACHRRGVAHRDIKPDNVLFDGEGRVRLADFGSAACFGDGGGEGMSGLVGTPYYVAPEVVAGGEYGEKVDVWSLGVVMYLMLSGTVPFYGETAGEVLESVVRGSVRFPARLFREVTPAAKDLMRRMICKEPIRRFSAEQVLRHPWIASGGGVARSASAAAAAAEEGAA